MASPAACRRTGFSIDCLRASAPQSRKTSFKKLKYHSPLEGESQKPSRMAKPDAVGADACLSPLLRTPATPRWPPTGSTAGVALVSPTPPQGGSDTRALNRASRPFPGRMETTLPV
jgi:hypothetical protein